MGAWARVTEVTWLPPTHTFETHRLHAMTDVFQIYFLRVTHTRTRTSAATLPHHSDFFSFGFSLVFFYPAQQLAQSRPSVCVTSPPLFLQDPPLFFLFFWGIATCACVYAWLATGPCFTDAMPLMGVTIRLKKASEARNRLTMNMPSMFLSRCSSSLNGVQKTRLFRQMRTIK